jgi:hypothetical protein
MDVKSSGTDEDMRKYLVGATILDVRTVYIRRGTLLHNKGYSGSALMFNLSVNNEDQTIIILPKGKTDLWVSHWKGRIRYEQERIN